MAKHVSGLLGQKAAAFGEAPCPLPHEPPGDSADRQPSPEPSTLMGLETRGVIHLPTGTIAAEANDEDPQVARTCRPPLVSAGPS